MIPQKAKEKVQSAPKKLLRRGLLDGTEKIYGQLRDTAQGGQREDTAADRMQGTTERGARLAVDRLGRMRLGKKKGKGQSSDVPPESAPPSSGGAESPAPATERVQIKTRDAVRDSLVKVYGEGGQSERPASARPSVKTKEAYIHRQMDAYGEVRQKSDPVPTPQTPEHTVSVNSPRSVRQTVKTKESFIRQQAVARNGRSVSPAPTSQPFPIQPEASQPVEQGRQKFIQERTQKATMQKAEGCRIESVAPMPTERHEIIESPPSAPKQRSSDLVRRATNAPLSKQKISEKDAVGGKFSIKEARSKQPNIKQPSRNSIKATVDSPRQAVKTAEYSGKAVQQGTHAAQQTTRAVRQSARVAQQTARANLQAPRWAVQAAGEAKRKVAAVGRPAAKAAVSALRGAVSALRAAVAPLAAGGGAVVTVVLVLCMVGALLLSPMGILFSGESTGGSPITKAICEINQEYDDKLEELKAASTYDELSMSGSRAPWREVLAVYAVKTTSDPTNGQEVVTVNDEKKELLKQVFWDMNEVISFTSTVAGESDEEDITTLYITATPKTADEMADLYGFYASQRQQLAELLSDEHRELWSAALGFGTGNGGIVAVALSQVGNVGGQPYWSWYGFSYRVDWCAIFVSWCADQCGYIDTGAMPKFAGCVQGSQWFKDRGRWQDRSYEPQPGDVIFYDWDDPGGFSGPQDGVPDHVGIVERVENGRVYTVEGNSGDKCVQRSYPVGYYEIYGYGTLEI